MSKVLGYMFLVAAVLSIVWILPTASSNRDTVIIVAMIFTVGAAILLCMKSDDE